MDVKPAGFSSSSHTTSRSFIERVHLNPADAPSRRPDYCAGRQEDDTPVSQLLPSLRSKVAESCVDTVRSEPVRLLNSEVELKKRYAWISACAASRRRCPCVGP